MFGYDDTKIDEEAVEGEFLDNAVIIDNQGIVQLE